MAVAENVTWLAATVALKVFAPTNVPSEGVQVARPLALVVEAAHAATEPPPLKTAHETEFPAPTALPLESVTKTVSAAGKG